MFVCTGDGTIRTFKEVAGGLDGKVPVYGEDFTYTGEYEIIDDTDALGTWWRIKFKTSGKLILLKNFIGDIFLVGGGGSGGGFYYDSSGRTHYVHIGSGGGGGYTKTLRSIEFIENTEYEILIGDGGTGVTGSSSGKIGGNTRISRIEDGTVSGGNGGKCGTSTWSPNYSGGNGGSGGVGGGKMSGGYLDSMSQGAGGSDGNNGGTSSYNHNLSSDTKGFSGGTGQGSTTREFEETFGDLYAGGGAGGFYINSTSVPATSASGGAGGGGNAGTAGTINLGGGGGAANRGTTSGAGGSGIVIIRNHRE